MLTVERLKQLLHYDPETGIFVWLVKPSPGARMRIGDAAGSRQHGYVYIGVDGRGYPAHHLAWLYVTGEWPVNEIDHRDTVRSNNRFENLRDVTRSLNQQNQRKARSHSQTGFLGVAPSRTGKFRATIKTPFGAHRHLGTFATPEQAHRAYVAAKRELHAGGTL